MSLGQRNGFSSNHLYKLANSPICGSYEGFFAFFLNRAELLQRRVPTLSGSTASQLSEAANSIRLVIIILTSALLVLSQYPLGHYGRVKLLYPPT
jgi:hypothetical protein